MKHRMQKFSPNLKKCLAFCLLVLSIYLFSYALFRSQHIEVWEDDHLTYVIFPGKVSYYFFRPIVYFDEQLSNVEFHIGPHNQ